MGKGLFITMEGPDGSGKSTQIQYMKEYFEANNIPCLFTREPGGTPIGEKLRNIILDKENAEMCDMAEALLYAASRAQHVEELIKPALDAGKVIFFAGGTGHPYFSTDTGAVLRAIEIEADAMLLAKAIDGIYDSDPKLNPEAKKYDEISIQETIDKRLAAVDLAASILCMENKMPMLVFGLNEENSIVETMKGTFTGTKVTV